MPKKTASISNKFINRSNQLEVTRLKVESLDASGSINFDDIQQVYAGLFLDIFTEFEALIEDLFIGLLAGEYYSSTTTVKRLVRIVPKSKVQDIVFNGRQYLDWLPYRDYTIPRANRYFKDGEPFTRFNDPQKENLKKFHFIRNALAHKSQSALAKFQQIINNLPLLPHEKTPAGYLRSTPHGSSQTQYQIAVLELEVMALKLCS
jgi:hypothetical protein